MTIRRAVPKITAAIAVSASAVLAAIVVPALAQNLPDGNGKELVETICTSCHDLSPITGNGLSRADWETVVRSMIDMGAPIKAEQIPVITTYLATNFPPKP